MDGTRVASESATHQGVFVGAPTLHVHRIAAPSTWPWLPTRKGGPMVQHPFCEVCGLIKAIGSERPLKQGGIVNLVAALSERFTATGRKVTEAQRRLINKKLTALQVEDTFAYTRASQLAVFVQVFGDYTGVPKDIVVSHMENL